MVDKDKLRIIREINGYDVRKLSRKLKVSKRLINDWESGKEEIDEINLDKLCEIYDIDKKELYKDSDKFLYIISIIISIVISIITYVVFNDICILITNLISLIIISIMLIYIKNNYTKDNLVPKSVFGIKLKENKSDRIKLYLKESILVASIYTIISNILKILELNIFVIQVYLIPIRSVNDIVIAFITYLLLSILTFIIELGFGEYIYKKGNEYGTKECS